MNRSRKIAWAIFGTAAVVAFAAWWLRAPRVEVAEVTRGTVEPVIRGRGEILPPDRIDAFPRVIGRLSRILVARGDRVREGQTLAELDGAPYVLQAGEAEAAVERAAAETERAAAALEAALRKLDRARELARKRIASGEYLQAARLDGEKSRSAYEVAREALAAARERLAGARGALARTRIAAPISGVVVAVRARVGQTVSERESVASVADADTVVASIEVERTARSVLVAGLPATVTLDASKQSTRGRVREVVETNKNGGSAYLTVMIALLSRAPAFRAGMKAHGRIDAAPKNGVIALPVTALVPPGRTRHHEAGVFVPESGRAVWRPVVVGATGDRFAEIVSGVQEGEWIVAGPARVVQRLKDGERIASAGRKEE